MVALDENEDAIDIFFMVKNQYIVGPGGPIAINQLAIHAAMTLYRVSDPQRCFVKVVKLSEWWLNKILEKAEP